MEVIKYKSTRGGQEVVDASYAILKGLADDGGLYMPEKFPKFDFKFKELMHKGYKETAYEVMKLLLSDYTKEELMDCIEKAYDDKFDTKEIAPLVKADGAYFLELFHGDTIAFKDMALSILPHLLTTAAKKNGIKNKIVILTATSGDTGKAAMSGFCDVEGTGIIVFYPKSGVSNVQRLQMVTQKGDNTDVVAIHGNFDDAQSGVKKIFADKEFAKKLKENGIQLSSANSINIGRLVPQIAYYVYAYLKLLANGDIDDNEKINVCVPTGNFGNILAAYIAKQMGLPVNKLICASNENKVLFDFFENGVYDRNRKFILTSSPSMDILISSNLERLIYLSCGGDGEYVKKLMQELAKGGKYTVTPAMKDFMKDFVGGYADEKMNFAGIKSLYDSTGYIIDTHTGVAYSVYQDYKNATKDMTATVIASTASPYKFADSVLEAILGEKQKMGDFEVIDKLHEIGAPDIPRAILEIKDAPVRHTRECDSADMQKEVEDILFNNRR